jgi:hypothetical protein
MIKFIGDRPWARITTLAKQAQRSYVAVPYLHGGATRMLPLNKGDVLKVNVMSCQVDPNETQKISEKRRERFHVSRSSCEGLHPRQNSRCRQY